MPDLSRTLVRPQFRRPEESLNGADARTVGSLIATAADLALVIDADHVVCDVAISADGIPPEVIDRWISRPAEETVTVESRAKLRDLIENAGSETGPRWREVNHVLGGGLSDLPVSYTALRTDDHDRVMLLGRDLRSVAVLQRRLISAQQSMEQDYARLLTMEARYRLLFESTGEAFLVVDAISGEVIEANGAAGHMFGEDNARLTRRTFPFGFDQAGLRAAGSAAGSVRATGRPETLGIRLADQDRQLNMTISLFRAEDRRLFLIRLTHEPGALGDLGPETAPLLALPRRATESVVLCDPEGRILWANESFLDLAQIAALEQIRGDSLDRFFSRRGIDLSVMLSNAREHGRLRFFATTLTGAYGSSTDVEVSIIRLPEIEGGGFGFILRNVALRPGQGGETGASHLPRSAEQMTDLVGRVPLKDLVRDTVDVIERLCIEAALKMTGDNRASAADLLGLSRQSLYVKLRRYGIADLDSDSRD